MSTEVSTELVGESVFPKEGGYSRRIFPRISFTSQDKTEGKGKAMKVVEEAGTFFTEKPTEELNEKGKNVWNHVEIGKAMEGIIFFTRKKLSYYDQANAKYISSSYFDQDTDVTVLWSEGKEIARGTKAELQAPYYYIKEDGKNACRLAENKVLYIYYQGEIFELTIKGSSMYEYSGYAKSLEANKQLTRLSYEDCENGSIVWSKILFNRVRQLTQEEWDITRTLAIEMNEGILAEKAYFASLGAGAPSEQGTLDSQDWSPDAVKAPALGDGKGF